MLSPNKAIQSVTYGWPAPTQVAARLRRPRSRPSGSRTTRDPGIVAERSEQQAHLRAALDGDAAAVREIVDQLTPIIQARVARCLLRSTRSRDVRQDVKDHTQDIFLHLFENDAKVLRSWEPGRGMSFENFVGLIAERRTVSALRSGKRTAWREDDVYEDDDTSGGALFGPEQSVVSGDMLRQLLYRLHEELSPLGWRLFQLLYLAEKSVEEVRAETEMSADAVYAWRSRLRRLARQRFEELTTVAEMAPAETDP